jgi:hypothetical protein
MSSRSKHRAVSSRRSFLRKRDRVRPGASSPSNPTTARAFPAAIVMIDVRGGSRQSEVYEKEMEQTLSAFWKMVSQQFELERQKVPLIWGGDGGAAVFDASQGHDQAALFADKILKMMPYFNVAHGVLNHLPVGEISIRVVCHAGTLRYAGDPSTLHGTALNQVMKWGKAIEYPGHVSLSAKFYDGLSKVMKDRMQRADKPRDKRFGEVSIMDARTSYCTLRGDDQDSNLLLDWIRTELTAPPHSSACSYEELKLFTYTNERLGDLLVQLEGTKVRVLCRNWLEDEKEAQAFNELLLPGCESDPRGLRRRWDKSGTIRERAQSLVKSNRNVEIRFYDGPPIFGGAILSGETRVRAGLGFYRWKKFPQGGGSQYKLGEWTTLCLDGRDDNQRDLLNTFESRFEETWAKAKSFAEVCEAEAEQRAHDPQVIGKIWRLDGQPYLLVYPSRPVRGFRHPLSAVDDNMAHRRIDKFLNRYGATTKDHEVNIPWKTHDQWCPLELHREIEAWPGHVVFVCSNSLPEELYGYLKRLGFPYDISIDKKKKLRIRHATQSNIEIVSTENQDQSRTTDFALIAKFQRENKTSFGYIVAGLRAIGTLAAASYLIDPAKIDALAKEVDQKQFAAIVKTVADADKHELFEVTKFMGPETFRVPASEPEYKA